jgi:hypothetical protein
MESVPESHTRGGTLQAAYRSQPARYKPVLSPARVWSGRRVRLVMIHCRFNSLAARLQERYCAGKEGKSRFIIRDCVRTCSCP